MNKVKSFEWKLRECKERIPGTYEGAKKLLEFGLELTSRALADLDSPGKKKNDSPENSVNGVVSHEELKLYRQIFVHYSKRLETFVRLSAREISREILTGSEASSDDEKGKDKEKKGGEGKRKNSLALARDRFSAAHYLAFRSTPLVYTCVSFVLERRWEDLEFLFKEHPRMSHVPN